MFGSLKRHWLTATLIALIVSPVFAVTGYSLLKITGTLYSDDTVLVGSGTDLTVKSVPNCTDVTGNHLNYTASSNAFSCGTSGTGGVVTTGTFTATENPGCSGTNTVDMAYVKVGDQVSVHPTGGTSLSCTSDSTSFAITGFPAAIRPTTTSKQVACVVVDNAASQLGSCTVDTSGVVTFARTATALLAAGWTPTGSKGFPNSFSLTYTVDATNP